MPSSVLLRLSRKVSMLLSASVIHIPQTKESLLLIRGASLLSECCASFHHPCRKRQDLSIAGQTAPIGPLLEELWTAVYFTKFAELHFKFTIV